MVINLNELDSKGTKLSSSSSSSMTTFKLWRTFTKKRITRFTRNFLSPSFEFIALFNIYFKAVERKRKTKTKKEKRESRIKAKAWYLPFSLSRCFEIELKVPRTRTLRTTAVSDISIAAYQHRKVDKSSFDSCRYSISHAMDTLWYLLNGNYKELFLYT